MSHNFKSNGNINSMTTSLPNVAARCEATHVESLRTPLLLKAKDGSWRPRERGGQYDKYRHYDDNVCICICTLYIYICMYMYICICIFVYMYV